MFFPILKRDLCLLMTDGESLGRFFCVFLLSCSLFVFSLGGEDFLLRRCGTGIIWGVLCITALFSTERIFADDWEEGTLDILFSLSFSKEAYVGVKMVVHWLTTAAPTLLLMPILFSFFALSWEGYSAFLAKMVLGTAVLSMLSVMGAALSFGAQRLRFMVFLLTAPLLVPLLILVTMPSTKTDPAFIVLLLGVLSLAMLPLCLWVGGQALLMHCRT